MKSVMQGQLDVRPMAGHTLPTAGHASWKVSNYVAWWKQQV